MQEDLRRFKAEIFQALAHPTRIAIVEMLRDGEQPVAAIFERLGVDQANASQHLAVLRAKQIVVKRKMGNQGFYAIRNPLLIDVLDIMRRYFHEHLAEMMTLLEQARQEDLATSELILPERPTYGDDQEAPSESR
jgi:DNA-binding transcriptional ArsR family regulator